MSRASPPSTADSPPPAFAGPGVPPATRVRHRVAGWCVALAMVTYLDRACIGVLAGEIRRDLGLGMREMGLVFSAFAFAYALFELPTAWLAEVIGPRRTLTRIVAWWSAFTMLTAAAWNYPSLVAIRFLFGAGEAGAWPGAMRTFSRWIPAPERGRVQGIFFAGAHLAAGLTPPLALLLAGLVGWRLVFVMFGLAGFAWVCGWHRFFRDHPREHPGVNATELDYIQRNTGPAGLAVHSLAGLASVLARRDLWLLCVVAFANTYGFYFVITWLPSFLQTLGLSTASLALYAGLPMILAVPADLLGGVTTDWLGRKFGLRAGRALVGGSAYLVAAAGMLLASRHAAAPHLAAVLLALGAGASMFALAASWSACIELNPAGSGIGSAVMNTAGQIGGIVSPALIAWLVERSGTGDHWQAPLQVIGGLYLAAALCWCVIDASRGPAAGPR